MDKEQEPKPLWCEGKDPESFDTMDSDTVIYNLHEDILCQKEDIDLLQNTIKEQRRIIESLVTPAEEVTGKRGSSAVLLHITRLEVERDDLNQLLKQAVDVEIEVTQERDKLSAYVDKLRDFTENKSGYKDIRSDLFQDKQIKELLKETK